MINFLKYKLLYGVISTIVIAVGLFSIVRFGYSFSIDFVGGSVLEYQWNTVISEKDIRLGFSKEKVAIFSLQKKDPKTYLMKTDSLDTKKEKQLRERLRQMIKSDLNVLRFETVGPVIGKETQVKTLVAAAAAVVGILLYVSFTFAHMSYGVSAILALLHDFLVVVGSYSLLSRFAGAEVDTFFVTALLTTMSFSVHDTVVIFGKIKEHKKSHPHLPFTDIANRALTETMVRSLNNSLTIVLMLVSLVLLGGATTRFFVITLLIGTITGTYSSPFVAVPILAMMERKKQR